MSLVNTIISYSNIETPAKQYLERLGYALEKNYSKNILLQKEVVEARKLL